MNGTTQAQKINKRQDKIFDEAKGLKEKALLKLWEDLGDIPVNSNDKIDRSFLHFDKGTNREEVWHWFDDEYSKLKTGKSWFKLLNY